VVLVVSGVAVAGINPAVRQGPRPVFKPVQPRPARLDFPPVWDGGSQLRTVDVTTPGAGYVSASLPAGAFRIVGMRAYGSQLAMGAGKGAHGPTATRAIVASTSSAPWQLNVPAGADVQTEVVFAPKFDLLAMPAGPKSATLRLEGPGAHGRWTATVPVDGKFDGLHVGVAFVVNDKSVEIAYPHTGAKVRVTLTGLGENEAGTVRAMWAPAGVSVDQVQVTVPKANSVRTWVPVRVDWSSVNGWSGNIPLEFDYGGKKSTANFSLWVYHAPAVIMPTGKGSSSPHNP
jgi:hypothetical protein